MATFVSSGYLFVQHLGETLRCTSNNHARPAWKDETGHFDHVNFRQREREGLRGRWLKKAGEGDTHDHFALAVPDSENVQSPDEQDLAMMRSQRPSQDKALYRALNSSFNRRGPLTRFFGLDQRFQARGSRRISRSQRFAVSLADHG